MTQSLEKRIEVLEGQQPIRKQVVVVCLPGEEDEAVERYLAEHPDIERRQIMTVVSVIERAPNEGERARSYGVFERPN